MADQRHRPGRQGFPAVRRGGGAFLSVDEQLRGRLERGLLGRRSRRKAKPAPAEPGAGLERQLTAAEQEVAERLQKVMARAGVASRRHCEALILAGRVTVNGQVVTKLGTKVVPGKDVIEVDGRPLGRPENKVYVMLNKPKGYVSTLYDPQGRPKVIDLLGDEVAERVYPVGRLDYDSEGLLLLTNDGDLAHGLMHPSRMVKKTYIVKVRGVPSAAKLRALQEGIQLEDGPTAPADVKLLEVRPPNSATLSIRIHEGRNRQVRRMFAALGHEVIHLRRTTLGPLKLGDLPVGQWRYLTEQEVAALYRAAGLRLGGKPRKRKGRR
ncbi:MAG: pseudouridine synthase [Bacillota bacterium]